MAGHELRHVTPERFAEVRHVRATDPTAIARAHAARSKRPLLGENGRLFILAADHPARGALGVGDEPMAMADRYLLLDRLALALSRPGVDGVLATPDIIDDLALLGALDDKVVVGSMNRGGLRGASFEMDDRYTGYDIPGIVRDGLDFAKCLLRINLDDAGTSRTLEATARAVTAAAEAGVPIMLEPFMSLRRDGAIVNDLSAEAVITSVAIAAGLGTCSAYTWMKLPVVDDMERVMSATTLPTLLLGGERADDPEATYASWQRSLDLPGVRGLVVGRALVYPPDGDVERAVDTAAALVHAR
ncbi:deoxyribose-phosphate aldolase [Agromyces sp. CFH 90414]|uniref:Deoxyribose-phosphate aldolase n=1 Tax=Agromyces agglutinans TaxID=2662258 RepID=A0A6I2F5G6_9MICO|nr:deoxyribose-phosphate aldolase [Agromyces agglutinans]MRG59882.1 deoxyribose-phosphate aldolase [Agromyces agglutinans]